MLSCCTAYLGLAVCIVPVVDQCKQEPDAVLGCFVQDVVKSLEGMLTVLAYNQQQSPCVCECTSLMVDHRGVNVSSI